jgi:hypothetical protein
MFNPLYAKDLPFRVSNAVSTIIVTVKMSLLKCVRTKNNGMTGIKDFGIWQLTVMEDIS